MTKKVTLESSIAERLDALSPLKPSDRDAFVNHLTILGRAEIREDHHVLLESIQAVATNFGMRNKECVHETCANVTRWLRIHSRTPRMRAV